MRTPKERTQLFEQISRYYVFLIGPCAVHVFGGKQQRLGAKINLVLKCPL